MAPATKETPVAPNCARRPPLRRAFYIPHRCEPMPNAPPVHRPAGWKPVAERAREFDRERGGSAARGYGYRWQKLRVQVLMEEPLCRVCWADGAVTAATDVDHIVPRAKGGTDERGNLQALCRSCHSVKTSTEDGGWGRGGKSP